MAEPLKGGQQFFSNYLKSFRDTVDKQAEIVAAIESVYGKLTEIVPKFASPSNTTQYQKTYGTTTAGKPINQTTEIKIKMYVDGIIRITGALYNTSSGTGLKLEIMINGVKYGQVLNTVQNGRQNFTIDVPVSEGDEVSFKDMGTVYDYLRLENYQIKYTLNTKPNQMASD